jgi:hypothetical protein
MMMIINLFLCVYFLLNIDVSCSTHIAGLFPSEPDPSDDTEQAIANIHWTTQCEAMFLTAMSLADQYGIHVHDQPINYTTHRLSSSLSGFAEFDAVCKLITDTNRSDIIGIVGTGSSASAGLIGMLTGKIVLPMISYAATSAELADNSIYPTLYRIVPSDGYLAEALVQLFHSFSWKKCVFILSKNSYGYGGLQLFSEEYSANVSIQNRIVFDPQHEIFHPDLKHTIKFSRSRIILVWADQNSVRKIIRYALDAGLVNESYIWLLTSQVIKQTNKQTDRQILSELQDIVIVYQSFLLVERIELSTTNEKKILTITRVCHFMMNRSQITSVYNHRHNRMYTICCLKWLQLIVVHRACHHAYTNDSQ